ncbi:hypothetical protein Taro_010853 [Colocasia esculenta]|uniref:Uncharacterized protein n=1 Tax=Colocasia esculenta TaxID=4460 RepID=A0A843U8M9_COLES|nr:hypothetical protein [Colocasia esculenta]
MSQIIIQVQIKKVLTTTNAADHKRHDADRPNTSTSSHELNLEGSKGGNELRERSPVGNLTPHRFDSGNKNNIAKQGRKNNGTKVNKLTTPSRRAAVTQATSLLTKQVI